MFRKLSIIILMFCLSHGLFGQEIVHDALQYVYNTAKGIQDELYQQLDLDFQMAKLGKTGEILKRSIETVKIGQETFSVVEDMYSTSMDIYGSIGDPAALVSYMNSRFWNEHEIDAAIDIMNGALAMKDGDIANTSRIQNILDDIEYGVRDVELEKSKNLAKIQKSYYAARKITGAIPQKVRDQLAQLNEQDKLFNPRKTSLLDIEHANYKTNIWQANTLGQMHTLQAIQAKMTADQFYNDGLKEDMESLERAQAIAMRDKIHKGVQKAIKEEPSLSDSFWDKIVRRVK